MNPLLERFCRYVRIDTQAIEGAETFPSSQGQLDLGRLLVQELLDLGLDDVMQDDFGIVMATIPATVPHTAPVMAWFAHMDTSPETTGANVDPQVIENYNGRDIVLPKDPTKIITVDANPELANYVGATLVTTDGTTLLGADNKSGIAVIMEAADFLLKNRDIPHGPIRICFTCDEEIGKGPQHVDLERLGAFVGYTLDGAGQGEIEGATFSADKATVTITGVNIHPSIGKGRMVNAIRLAGQFLERLPKTGLSPETTSGLEGFVHPYTMDGTVAKASLHFLLRDFETAKLDQQAELFAAIGRQLEEEFPPAKVEITRRKQYRNMAEGIAKEPRALAFAEQAMKQAGLAPRFVSLRGGTDGAQFTERGLPTPNLSTGEHNPHSPLEWTALEDMQTAVKVLVELAKIWGAATA